MYDKATTHAAPEHSREFCLPCIQHLSPLERARLILLLPLSHEKIWELAHDVTVEVREAAIYKRALTTAEYWALFTQDEAQAVQRAAFDVAGDDFDAAALYSAFFTISNKAQIDVIEAQRFTLSQYEDILKDTTMPDNVCAAAFKVIRQLKSAAACKALLQTLSPQLQQYTVWYGSQPRRYFVPRCLAQDAPSVPCRCHRIAHRASESNKQHTPFKRH